MTEKRHSYGIIPLYKKNDHLEALLIRQEKPEGTLWSFPKGHPEAGESPIETARREVQEEVGITFGDIEEQTFSEHYLFERDGRTIDKTATYYIGFADTNTFVLQASEVAGAAWLSIDAVEERLTFMETKALWKKVLAFLHNSHEVN